MNPEKKSNFLKLFTLGSALLTCALRAAHYGFGTDGRGLLIPNHWSVWGISVVSAVFGAVLLLLGSSIPRKGDAPRPASPVSAAGCFALGAVLLAAGLRSFGESGLPADYLIWALGLCAGTGLILVGICRWSGKKPYFLFHAFLCLYIALRMVSTYRQWSSEPQLQDYGFYLMAHAAIMLTAYHHAAFDAGLGSHRALWICSLCTVFLGCAALPRCGEPLLMGAAALWAFTNLTAIPLRQRRTRPVLKTEESGDETA